MKQRVKPRLYEIYYEKKPFYIPGFYWRVKTKKFLFYTLDEALKELIQLKKEIIDKKQCFSPSQNTWDKSSQEKEKLFYEELDLSKFKIVKYGIIEKYDDTGNSISKMEIGELTNGGIYAGEYENKPLILALNDLPQKQTWNEAIKSAPKGWRLPSRIEWLIMLKNKDKINAALEKHGGKKLSEDDWYWSSSEYSSSYAWYVYASDGDVYAYGKGSNYSVRCVLA